MVTLVYLYVTGIGPKPYSPVAPRILQRSRGKLFLGRWIGVGQSPFIAQTANARADRYTFQR